MDLGYFELNRLIFKLKKMLKLFYHFLILLSGDISLNAVPSQCLQDNDKKFEPFHQRGLHFLHINVNR